MIRRVLLLIIFLLAAPGAFAQNFDGVWLSKGYGQVLEIDGSGYVWYEYTPISLISIYEGTLDGNGMTDEDGIFEGTLSLNGANLVLTFLDENITVFQAMESLPPETEGTDDPEVNFDIFWQTYEETGVLFPLTGVDWQATYDQYRPQVNQTTTNEELFNIFVDMIEPLNDGHSYIEDDDGDQEFEGGPDTSDRWDLDEEQGQQVLDIIEENHIDGTLYVDSTLTYSANRKIASGTINNGSIGYINLIEFSDVSSNPDDDQSEYDAFTQAIDNILTVFQNTGALIVDLRFNSGGLDWLVRAFADRLTDQQRLVWTKQVRAGGYTELSDPVAFYIKPQGVQWLNRPIAVLTSGSTLSAGETQVLALKVLPNVTLIGERTYGIFSDVLDKELPNGWDIGVTNELFVAADGISYEQVGIAPDIEVSGAEDGFDQGQDLILESALEHLDIPVPVAPTVVTGVLNDVGSSWETVTLPESFNSMVVVGTLNYSEDDDPAVVRIRNAAGNSFQIKVQNPDGDWLDDDYTVHYVVVEEGVYTQAANGVKMEAVKFNSSVTDHKSSWNGQSRSYANSYSRPVVLGQVMTTNDSDWSVFWAHSGSRTTPPSSSGLFVGKHVGEDSDTSRANETIAYIVLEASSGNIGDVPYIANVGADTVEGIEDDPSYDYALSGLSSVSAALVSASGMDGNDGGWPVLYEDYPATSSTLKLAFDEDVIGDWERSHTSEQVAYAVFGLPLPWQNKDVGNPNYEGDASHYDGQFTINGGGYEIWDDYDEFHYVYRSFTGDGEIVAHVLSVEETDSSAQAGVMIRDTLYDGSKHAMMAIFAGGDTSFEWREQTDGYMDSEEEGGPTSPIWVKLVREGDTFTGYTSNDGSNWNLVGSTSITMSDTVHIGLIVNAGDDDELSMAEFDNVSVTRTETLNNFIADQMEQANMPGFAGAIVINGEIVWSDGYGVADLATGLPVTADTLFNMASISKTFVATALMQAVEDGYIGLDNNVNDYLPFVVDNPQIEGEVITPRDLATHTSGILDNEEFQDSDINYHEGEDNPILLGDFMREYFSQDGLYYDSEENFADTVSGETYEYTNVGAALAGYLVGVATNVPFDDYTEQNIFGPLGMSSTGWHMSDVDMSNHVTGHTGEDEDQDGQPDVTPHIGLATYPDGGLRTSANDLGRFLAMVMNGGELNGERVLEQATVDEMLELQVIDDEYQGIFWFGIEDEEGNQKYIGHDGDDPGTTTIMAFDPEEKIGVLGFTNIQGRDDEVEDAIEEIRHRLFEEGARLLEE